MTTVPPTTSELILCETEDGHTRHVSTKEPIRSREPATSEAVP